MTAGMREETKSPHKRAVAIGSAGGRQCRFESTVRTRKLNETSFRNMRACVLGYRGDFPVCEGWNSEAIDRSE